jgi:hypothetical protein
LADALAALEAERKPRSAKHWVRKLPSELRPIKGRMARRLVERSVLSEERRKVLGLVSKDRYPAIDPEPERVLRERLRAELTGATDVSSRTALLIPLLRAHGLIDDLVTAKDERREARRRAKEITRDPGKIGAAVGSVLSDTQLAVQAAVTAAVFAGGDGGGDGGDGGGSA